MGFDGAVGTYFLHFCCDSALQWSREKKKKKVNDDFYQYNTESVCNGLLTFQKRKMSLFLREFNYLKGWWSYDRIHVIFAVTFHDDEWSRHMLQIKKKKSEEPANYFTNYSYLGYKKSLLLLKAWYSWVFVLHSIINISNDK